MYSTLQLASKYLKYYIAASNGKGHGIHSPFIFEFITKVLNDKGDYAAYTEVERIRLSALRNDRKIKIVDMGAGSSGTKDDSRTISSIARHAVKPKKYGQLLYRMVQFYKPAGIVELGTSLGITTSYLAKANPGGKVLTFEGAGEVLKEAKNNFTQLGIDNIETIEGNFDGTLIAALRHLPAIDFAFIDGNHRRDPTIQYFHAIQEKANNFSIIVLDDIHWSSGMEEAWKYCAHHSSVTLSIDLFFIGILIFRREIKEKQHFVIRF